MNLNKKITSFFITGQLSIPTKVGTPLCFAVFCLFFLASPLWAATTTWLGTSDTDWNNSSNWSNGTPSTNDIAIIEKTGSYDPTWSSGYFSEPGLGELRIMAGNIVTFTGDEDWIQDVTIQNGPNGGGKLIISGGTSDKGFYVTGDFTFNGGTIQQTNGFVRFYKYTSQFICGTKESGSSLSTTADSAIVSDSSATFQSTYVKAGDCVLITSGSEQGFYVVASVDSETQLTLEGNLHFTDSVSYKVKAMPYFKKLEVQDHVLTFADETCVTVTDPINPNDLSKGPGFLVWSGTFNLSPDTPGVYTLLRTEGWYNDKNYVDTRYGTIETTYSGDVPYRKSPARPETFYHLHLGLGDGDASNTVTLDNDVTVNGDFTVKEGVTLSNSNAQTIYIAGDGDWNCWGSYSNAANGNDTLQFQGNGGHFIRGTSLISRVLLGNNQTGTVTLDKGAQLTALELFQLQTNDTLNGAPTAGSNSATLIMGTGCQYSVAGTVYPRSGLFVWQKYDTDGQALNLPTNGANGYYDLRIDGGSGHNVTLAGNTIINNDLHIKSATLIAGANTLTITGDWSQESTFTQSTSTVKFVGSDSEILKNTAEVTSIASVTFNHLTIGDSDSDITEIFNNKSVVVNGTFTIDGTGATKPKFKSGVNTVFTTATWSNGGQFDSDSSEVIWQGGAIPEQAGGNAHEDFYSLTVDGAGSLDATNTDKTFTVHKHLKINPGDSLNAGASAGYTIELKGDFQQDGSFTAGDSKLLFNGTAQQTLKGAATLTLNDLEMNKTSGGDTAKTVELAFNLGGDDLTINGTTDILAGIFDLGASGDTIVCSGNLTVGNGLGSDDSTFKMAGNVTLEMANGTVIEIKNGDGILETVESGVLPTMTSSNPGTDFYTVKIAGKTKISGLKALSLGTVGTYTDSGQNHGFTVLTNADIYTPGSTSFDKINFDDCQGSGSNDTYLRVFRNASSPQLALEFNTHNYDDGAADTNVDINVYLDRGSTGASIVQSASSGNKGGSNGENFDRRDDGADPDPGSIQWPVVKVWTGNIDSDWHTDANWKLQGGGVTNYPTGGDSVIIPTDPDSNPDVWPVISTGNAEVKNLTMESQASLTTVLTASGTKILTIYGSWEVQSNAEFSSGQSTVDYAGSSSQALVVTTYYNLKLSNTSGVQAPTNPVTITNNFTINPDVDFTATTADIRLAGDWRNNGTFTPGNSLVRFNGNSGGQEQDINAGTFKDVEFSGSNEPKKINGAIDIQGDITVGDNVEITATNLSYIDIEVGGDWEFLNEDANINTSGTFYPGFSTVIFDGATAQELIQANTGVAVDFNVLELKNTGTTLKLTTSAGGSGSAMVTIDTTDNGGNTNLGNVKIGAGTTLDATNDTINCGGNWSAIGTFTYSGSTVSLNASAAQVIQTNAIFNQLTINNSSSSGQVTTNGDLTIDGDLTISDGYFNLGDQTYTVKGDVSISAGATLDMGTSTLTIGYDNAASAYGDLSISGTFYMAGTGVAYPTLKMEGDATNYDRINAALRSDIIINNGGALQCLTSDQANKPKIQSADVQNGPYYHFYAGPGATLNIASLVIDTSDHKGIIIGDSGNPGQLVNVTNFDDIKFQNTKGVGTLHAIEIYQTSGPADNTWHKISFDSSTQAHIEATNYSGLGITLTDFNSPHTKEQDREDDPNNKITWARTTVWTGSFNDDWSESKNWEGEMGPPGTTDSVRIADPGAGDYAVINTALGYGLDLQVEDGSKVVLQSYGLDLGGNVLIEGGTTGGNIDFTGNQTLYVGGNWTNQRGTGGLTMNSTGTIQFDGQSCTLNSEPGFYQVVIAGGAGYTTTLGDDAEVVVADGGFTINASTTFAGGNNTNQATFQTNVWTNTGIFSAGNCLFRWMADSTTPGASDAGDVPVETYYDLEIGKNVTDTVSTELRGNTTVNNNLTIKAGSTLSLQGYTLTVTGDLTIENGATLNGDSGIVNLAGNLVIDGSFMPTTSNFNFNKNGIQTISGSGPQPFTFNDITVASNATLSIQGNIKCATSGADTGDITVNDTLKLNSYQLELEGTYTDSGTLVEDTGTVFFNGTAQTIPNETWYNLKFGDASADTTYTLPVDTTVTKDIVFEENGILNSGGYTLYVGRHWDDNGSGDNFVEGAGEVQFNGSVQQNVDADTFNNLVISNTGVGVVVLAQGKLVVNGNLIVNEGELDLGTGLVGANSHSVGGYAYIDDGTLDLNTSSIAITGLTRIGNGTTAGLLDMTADSTDDPDLTATGGVEITSTGTLNMTGASATISCGDNWTDNGTFNIGNSKVVMTGASATLETAGTADFYQLEINSGGTVSAASNLGVSNNITVSVGTFDVVTYTVTAVGNISNSGIISIGTALTAGTLDCDGNFTGGTLTFVNGGGAQLNFAGTSFAPTTLNANDGTIKFDNTGADQDIPVFTYNHITIDKGSATARAVGNLIISGTLTITNGTFNADDGSARTHSIGAVSNSGALVLDLASTLNISGATTNLSTINIGPGTYNSTGDFTNTSGTTNLGTGLLDVNGNFSNGILDFGNSTGSLRIAGTFAPTTLNEDTGTIIFDGTTQTIPGETYYHLKTGSVATTYTLGEAIQVKGNLTIDETDDAIKSTLDVSGSASGITVTGNWVLNGSFTAQGGTVEFNGTSASISLSQGANGDALSFNHLKVNIGGSSVLQPSSGVTVGGNLDITGGELDLGSGLSHTVIGTSTVNKTLDINGSSLSCGSGPTVGSGGSLILRDSGVLKMADTTAITINGGFETYWSGGGATKPKITTSGTVGTHVYSFDANSGSSVDISGLTFESSDSVGLRINIGATIQDIDDVAFVSQVAPAGGAALNLKVTSGYSSNQSFTFSDMSFDGSYKNGAPNSSIGNVVVADNTQGITATITMSNAIDVVPGKEDWDYDDPIPGNGNAYVGWIDLNTWVGTTTNWSVASNWSHGVPDGTKDVLIPSVPEGGNFPILDTTGYARGLTIETGASLTESGSATVKLEISGDLVIAGSGTFDAGDGEVIFNGSGAQTIDIGTAAGNDFYDLEVNKSSGTVTVLRDVTITNGLTITGTLNSGGKIITVNGTTTNNGTIEISTGQFDLNGDLLGSGILDFGGSTGSVRFSGNTFNVGSLSAANGTIIFDSQTANQTIPVLNYYHLEIDKYSGVVSYTANAGATGIDVDGNFKITSGIFKADPTNAGRGHTIAGNWDDSGVTSEFNSGQGTITFDGTNQSFATRSGYQFYNLNIGDDVATPSVSVTSGDDLEVSNNLIVNTGSTLNLNSNTGHSVGGNATIDNTAKLDLLTGDLAVSGSVTNNGTLDLTESTSSLFCASFANTGTLDFGISSLVSMSVSGNWNDSGTVNPGNSTVNLSGGVGSTMATSGSTDFYHLNISGNYTANSNGLDIEGDVTISGIFDPDVYTHKVAGNWDDSAGAFSATAGTIRFDGTGSYFITTKVTEGGNNFKNLQIGDDIQTPFLTVTTGDDLIVTGSLIINTGSNLTLNSNTGHSVTGSVTIDTASTLYVKTGEISTGSMTNNGTIDLTETTSSNGQLTCNSLTNNATVTFGVGSGRLVVNGSFNNSAAGASFVKGNSTVEVGGGASLLNAPLVKGAFYHLVIKGTVSASSSLDIDGNFTVNNGGSLDLGSSSLVHDVSGTTSVSGTLNINNSTLTINNNLTVNSGGTLQIVGSDTSGQAGQLKVVNGQTVSIQGLFQTNPSGSYTYKPVVTRANTGDRYGFTVESNGGLDINGLVFEWADSNGLTIVADANIANIDIDNVDFKNVKENTGGTAQGDGARHLYVGFTSGSFSQSFDSCTFDTSFGTTTGNNVVGVATTGSSTVSFSNYGGLGSGPTYEWESEDPDVDIKWLGSTTWEGNNSNDWDDNGNWSNGTPGSENAAVVVYPASGRQPIMNVDGACASLEIKDDGNLDINGETLTINGDLIIQGGANPGALTMTVANSTVNIKDNWTNNGGALNQTAGQIVFNGANSIITAEPGFFNVRIDGTASIATGSSAEVSGAGSGFNINGGTFNLNNGTFTTNAWINSGTFNADTGIIIWLGTSSIPVATYYHLQVGDGSTAFSTTMTSSTYNISKNFTVKMTGDPDYLDAGSATINIGGHLTIDGSVTSYNVFRPANSNIIFDGSTTQNIGGTATTPYILNDINISGTNTTVVLQGDVRCQETGADTGDINSDLAAPLKGNTGTIKLNTYTLEVQGTYYDDSNDGVSSAPFDDNLSEDQGTVYLNVDQNTTAVTTTLPSETFYNLTVGSGSNTDLETHLLSADLTIANSLTITANSKLDVTANDYAIDIAGNWTRNGTFDPRNGMVTFNGTVNQNITSVANFNNLIINNTGTGTKVLAQGRLNATGNLTVADNTLDLGTGLVGANSHSVDGYLYVDKGTLDLNTSSISIGGLLQVGNGTTTGVVDMTGNSTDDPDLTATGGVEITSTGTLNMTGASATISCGDNWTDNGTFNIGNSKVIMTGASATLETAGTADFYQLEINSGGIVSAASNLGVSNDIAVSAGVFDVVTYTVTAGGNISNSGTVSIGTGSTVGTLDLDGNFTGGTLTFVNGGGAQLNFAGTSFAPATLNANDGTIKFDNTGADQDIPVFTYNHLTIDKGSATARAVGNLIISGTLTITNGTFNADDASVRTHSIGAVSNSGILTLDLASTLNVSGATTNTGTINIGPGTYNSTGNFTNTSGTTNLGTGLLDVNGNFSNGTLDFGNSTGALRIAGTFLPVTLNEDTGTIIFDGTSQAIPGETYYHLKTGSVATTYTLGEAIIVKGNLTIDEMDDATKSTLDVSGSSYSITVTGNWVLNGTFTAQGGTVEFNGTAASISLSKGTNGDALSFNHLKVNVGGASVLQPSSGVTVGGNSDIVGGELNLGSGLNHTVTGTTMVNNLPAGEAGTLDINGSSLSCGSGLTVGSGGSLILRDSGVLKMADATTITINGSFETYWSGGGATKPKITTSGTVGTHAYSFDTNSGSSVDISGLMFESSDSDGLRINIGAMIQDIDDVAFVSQVAPAGGAALNLKVTSGYSSNQSFTFSDMSFDGSYKNGAPNSSIGNVVVADNTQGITAKVTMSNAVDVVPGKEDWDYDDPTPGDGNAYVDWIELNTWVGNTTSWNDAGNWTYGIPDGTKDVLIPGGRPNYPILDTTGYVRGLTIEAGASLTESGSTTVNLELSGDLVIGGSGTFDAGDGQVIFNGSGSQTIDIGTAAGNDFYDLEANKSSGTVTMLRAVTVTNSLSITGTLNSGGQTVTINGSTTNNGTIEISTGQFDLNGDLLGSGTLDFGGSTGIVRFSGGTFNVGSLSAANGTIIFDNQTVNQIIPILNYYHLEIDKYSGVTSYTANATATGIDIGGNFKITSGIFKADPSDLGWSHTLTGNWDDSGVNSEFKPGQGRITFDGSSQSITSKSGQQFYNLDIGDDTATPSVSVTSGDDLAVSNSLVVNTGSTLNLNANTGHNVGGNATIDNIAKLDLLTGDLAVSGSVTNNGQLDLTESSSSLSCASFTNSGTLDFGVSSSAFMSVSGNWNDSGTVNPGNSTVNLTGGAGSTIATTGSTDFYNLNINGNYTANDALDIEGDVTINGLFAPGSYSHTLAGSWGDSNGTFTGGTGTIIFDGTTQVITTDTGVGNNKFNNLTIGDGTVSTPSVGITAGDDLEVGNNLVINGGNSAGSKLTLNANTVHTIGGNLIINADTYAGLLDTSTGKITVIGSCTNAGQLDLSSSVATTQGLKCAGFTNTGDITFGVSGAGIIECNGHWVDTGTFTLGNSTVKIIGINRTIKADRATGDFYNLIIDGSVSITTTAANGLDVDNTLKIDNGGSLDLGTGFVNDVAGTLDVGDASTTGTLNINNSELSVHGDLTIKDGTLTLVGSDTAANVGELKMGNAATVYVEDFFQTNPSVTYDYHPKVTQVSSGDRYNFVVRNSAGLDINGLMFEYADSNGLTIESTADDTNIDLDDVTFQYVKESAGGSGQGDGARHLYVGFTSGTYNGAYDGCLFDQSFGTSTGNNVVTADTLGSTTLNFTNWQEGTGGGDQYEYEGTGTSSVWVAEARWLGGAIGHETDWNWGANWNTGSKPGEGSSVIIQDRTYDPTLNETTTIVLLEVEDGAELNMSTSYDLTVNGVVTIVTGTVGGQINITNAGAVLTCESDLIDNNTSGGLNQTAGKVILLGPNSTFHSQTVKNLEIGDGTTVITVNTPTGKNVKMAANGTLTVKANAIYNITGGTLVAGDGVTININASGKFKASGNTIITTPTPGIDRFYFIVNGEIDLDGCTIKSMTTNGLDLQAGATVTNLKNISFYNHPGGSGRYLTMSRASLELECPGCYFDTITSGYNIYATGADSLIQFEDRFNKKTMSANLNMAASSSVVTDTTVTFISDNVASGDILRIESGSDIGTYVISTVDSETQLTITGTLSATAGNIKYSVGTALNGRGAGEPFDFDDDANDDGTADSGGAVVFWSFTANADMQGAIQGFPTAAFDLDTYEYYSTYAVSRDWIGTPNTADRITVLDEKGDTDYYYDVDHAAYGDVIGSVWWYTEATVHTVYFGTSDGYLFRLIDTGTALELSTGWPINACDEVTSPVISDGMNLYFGGRSGTIYKIFAYIIASQSQLFARTSASPVRATPSWDNAEGTTYLFVGSDYQELENRVDLQVYAGESYVTSASAQFVTNGLESGDVLAITSGTYVGRYRVLTVTSETQVTLDYTFGTGEAGISFNAGQTPLLYRLDVSDQVSDKGNNAPLYHVRAATAYWSINNGLYAGDYYGRMHGIDAFSDNFITLSNFPYSATGITDEIRVAPYPEFTGQFDPPHLLYGDMGGRLHIVDTDGTAYDPPEAGEQYPFRPDTTNPTTSIESSPMPDYLGLIYIGNNDGKVFIIDKSKGEVIKTYSFGNNVKIGDIGYNPDTDSYIVPTDEGKIYYLRPEIDPTP